MKKYLILLLVIVNLGLGVRSFSAMTKEEKTKLEKQIDYAYEKNDKKKLETLIIKYVTEFPNNADYLNRLAVLYLNLGDYDASEKLVRKGLELARKENDTEEIKELEETLDIIREAR